MAKLHAVHHRPTVLIAGAGVAGIEGLLALRAHLGGTVRIELLTPEPEFVYRPSMVASTFGLGTTHRLEVAQIAADQHAVLRHGALAAVEPSARVAVTDDGQRLDYDQLLVTVGARQRPALDSAITFGLDAGAFERLLEDLRSESVRRLAFVAPPGVAWLLPLYELALLTAWWARRQHLAPSLSLFSEEEQPLQAFGAKVSGVVERLLEESAIEFVSSISSLRNADAVVSIPRPEGPQIEGLPADEQGFIVVDRFGAVPGIKQVYAAGDGTVFPIKQGGLAAQQADAAASSIACVLGGSLVPEPFAPVLRGLLLTGDLPRYVRSANGSSEVDLAPLWWPPAKIAAKHLAPYLAAQPLTRVELADRPTIQEQPDSEAADEHEAIDLLLELAEANARRGSFNFALKCLDAAEQVGGPLPAAREAQRRKWTQHAAR